MCLISIILLLHRKSTTSVCARQEPSSKGSMASLKDGSTACTRSFVLNLAGHAKSSLRVLFYLTCQKTFRTLRERWKRRMKTSNRMKSGGVWRMAMLWETRSSTIFSASLISLILIGLIKIVFTTSLPVFFFFLNEIGLLMQGVFQCKNILISILLFNWFNNNSNFLRQLVQLVLE